MIEIQPIRMELKREEGGRTLASAPDLPGVMAGVMAGVVPYGATEAEAVRKVKSIALQGLADRIESGEDVPAPLKVLFAAGVIFTASLPTLLRILPRREACTASFPTVLNESDGSLRAVGVSLPPHSGRYTPATPDFIPSAI